MSNCVHPKRSSYVLELIPRGWVRSHNSELPFKGECMKKLFTVVFTMLVAGALTFGQAAGSTEQKPAEKTPAAAAAPDASGKKATKKAHHKGGKKKKGTAATTTPAPK